MNTACCPLAGLAHGYRVGDIAEDQLDTFRKEARGTLAPKYECSYWRSSFDQRLHAATSYEA